MADPNILLCGVCNVSVVATVGKLRLIKWDVTPPIKMVIVLSKKWLLGALTRRRHLKSKIENLRWSRLLSKVTNSPYAQVRTFSPEHNANEGLKSHSRKSPPRHFYFYRNFKVCKSEIQIFSGHSRTSLSVYKGVVLEKKLVNVIEADVLSVLLILTVL